MKKRMRKAGFGFLVGAVIVLGGGFASAGYSNGDGDSVPATATVEYTVQTFRAIELTGVDTIDFETVRQGETKTIDGPTILYGTTWPDDAVSVYLAAALENGVKLYVSAGTATPPEDPEVTCADEGAGAGVSASNVNISATTAVSSITSAYLIRDIKNCGAPAYDEGIQSPYDNPNLTALTWATATTEFTLDTTSAAQAGGMAANLYAKVTKLIYFVIDTDGV